MGMSFLSLILVTSIFVGCSTSNLFLAICMLELSMYTFLFMNYEYKFLGMVAGCIKYFFVQSVGSIFLFLGSVLMFLTVTNKMMHMLFMMGFFLKLGIFPFYFWVVPVSSALSYLMIGVFSSPMKILPVALMIQYFSYYMEKVNSSVNIIFFSGVLSMVVGMFLGLSSNSLRKMLGASSITHTGWLLITLPISCTWYYFIFYSLGVMTFFTSLSMNSNIMSSLSLLCLGGLPPFGVFSMKLWVIMNLLSISVPVVILVAVLITSVMSLFYYLKYSFGFFLLSTRKCPLPWMLVMLFTMNFFSAVVFIIFFYSQVTATAF